MTSRAASFFYVRRATSFAIRATFNDDTFEVCERVGSAPRDEHASPSSGRASDPGVPGVARLLREEGYGSRIALAPGFSAAPRPLDVAVGAVGAVGWLGSAILPRNRLPSVSREDGQVSEVPDRTVTGDRSRLSGAWRG